MDLVLLFLVIAVLVIATPGAGDWMLAYRFRERHVVALGFQRLPLFRVSYANVKSVEVMSWGETLAMGAWQIHIRSRLWGPMVTIRRWRAPALVITPRDPYAFAAELERRVSLTQGVPPASTWPG
jgi:hypothetical protein